MKRSAWWALVGVCILVAVAVSFSIMDITEKFWPWPPAAQVNSSEFYAFNGIVVDVSEGTVFAKSLAPACKEHHTVQIRRGGSNLPWAVEVGVSCDDLGTQIFEVTRDDVDYSVETYVIIQDNLLLCPEEGP